MVETKSTMMIYAIAAVTGALGGCAAGAHVFLYREGFRIAFVLAYAVIGAAVSVGVAGSILWQIGQPLSDLSDAALHQVIMASMFSGMVGSFALSLLHVASKIVLRWRGIEIEVVARKYNDKKDQT
jgi:hypothetical protein